MMTITRNLLIPLLLLAAFQCPAQATKLERKEDNIDIEYNNCINKDTAYANICNCAFVAYDKWNKELDNAYKKLMKSLKKDADKSALKTAQSAWLSFKNAEFKAYDNIFNLPGGKWCSLRQDGRIDVIRDRALQLRSYAEALKSK